MNGGCFYKIEITQRRMYDVTNYNELLWTCGNRYINMTF